MATSIIAFAVVAMATFSFCAATSKETDVKVTFLEFIQFNIWRYQHGKRYQSANATDAAIQNFSRNKRAIDSHNGLYRKGLKTFERGLWQHSDKSAEEKSNFLLGLVVPPSVRFITPNISSFPSGPATFDWNKQGLVGPVEDQGMCSSCWTFSSKGVVESILRRKNITTPLSPQQLVDCSKDGCWGCNGGWPQNSLDYIKGNGLAATTSYKYTAKEGTCKYNRTTMAIAKTLNQTFYLNTKGNETLLRDIVAKIGPVSIVMRVEDSFYNYKSGIYYEPKCGKTINHAMLLVGYGFNTKGTYWLIKNSWGTGWGEKGFVKFARNKDNMCNIADSAVYAT